MEYIKNPPTPKELDRICVALGVEPQKILRTGGRLYTELRLSTDDNSRSRGEWLTLLVENPELIERPIFVRNGKAVIGRPPENVLEIL